MPEPKLTPAMIRLIIAARVVAFERQDVEAINELDYAVEAFSEAVPWDDEPLPNGQRECGERK